MPRASASIALLLLAGACKPPPEERSFMPEADAARGKAAMERAGCGACHTIPGIRWPQGKVGPSLEGFADRGLIAGQLPNRPDILAAFLRNAPALLPGTTMPAMPLSEAESRDAAAYLYEMGER
ncbi:MAG: c-type cytochrome [Allosphingosinicella sp.]